VTLAEAQAWLLGLGGRYGVDPLVFAAIYVAAIPVFGASLAWLIRRLRAKRPIVLPMLATGLSFLSAYIYLAIAGRGLPAWVWAAIGALVALGLWSAVRQVRRGIRRTG
jgi:CHASE2 domain-containing sensor protein